MLIRLGQTISPVAVEIVGIKELPSALSLTWLSIVLPTTCKCLCYSIPPATSDSCAVSEPIGLYLRRPGHHDAYLYPQIFSGVLYLAAAACMFILRVWMLGKQDQKRTEMIGDEEEDTGDLGAEQALGESEGTFMHKWRHSNRWLRYAKV